MSNERILKYTSKRSKEVHAMLCDIKKLHITKNFFEKNEKFREEFRRKWNSFEDFEFYTNRYLWETYFRYDEEIIKNIVIKSKHIQNKHISNEEKLIEFFLFCYTVSPKSIPTGEKEIPKGRALTLEHLGIEEEDENGSVSSETVTEEQ